MKYKITNPKTGETVELDFHENHHEFFGIYNIQPRGAVKKIAAMLVGAWNIRSRGEYTYELVEEVKDATQ
jgi:hypothetical protein